jgi:hypothetical protein
MSRLVRIAIALLLGSAAVVACGDDETSFFLRVTGADGATQLEVGGVRSGERFGPQLLPEAEGAPFSGEQTVRVRFNTPPGAPVLIEVAALVGGERIAEGSAEATPRKGEEVELRIGLSPVTQEPGTDGGTDGGVPDAGEPDGGDTDGGTDGGDPDAGEPDGGAPDAGGSDAGVPDAGGGGGCTDCRNGCCQGNVCVNPPTVNSCGGGGEACRECPAGRADRCSEFGGCSCGESNAVCPEGQRCFGGACICDAASCPDGCCSAGACLDGDTNDSCGTAGGACNVCVLFSNCRVGRCQ